jgi:uncharacterized protein
MRLHLEHDSTAYSIRAYDQGYVRINDQEVRRSVVVMPQQLVTDWPPQHFAALEVAHFEALLALQPEIVLLGTGGRQRFPAPGLLRPLLGQRIGVEVMTTAAACRTYNIIMAEGRQVAAALLMIE